MKENGYPVLCGGTFFTLLLNAKKQSNIVRERTQGKTNSLSEPNVLIGLIKVFYPEYLEPKPKEMESFKSIVSKYKNCTIEKSELLSFLNPIHADAFEQQVKSDYPSLLKAMHGFTCNFIDTNPTLKRHVWLAKALLELIKEDKKSIRDTQVFYAQEDGQPISKSDLVKLDSICLPALLLGIWHFIVSRSGGRNKNGKDTYEKWHSQAGKHEKKEFTSHIGKYFQYPQNVSIEIDTISNTLEASSNVADVSYEASGPLTNSLGSFNNNKSGIILQSEIPCKENMEIVERTTEPKFKMGTSSVRASSLNAINNSQEYDEGNIVVDKLLFFHIILENAMSNNSDDYGDMNETMAENVGATILDAFTREIRNYEIVSFLMREDLETSRDIGIFVEKMEETCTPYKKYIERVLKTGNNVKEKKFFHALFDFIISLYSFNCWISFVRDSFRNITVLSRIKEEELSEFEENALYFHEEVIKSFCKICNDNNLKNDDIANRDKKSAFEEIFGAFYYSPNYGR